MDLSLGKIFMSKKTFLQKFRWIFTVSQRFSRIDRKGRSAVTSKLATAGIAVGVMTLIVVMSIMNGFQLSFIDSIQEISSYHLRIYNLPKDEKSHLFEFCKKNKNIKSCTDFLEAQSILTSEKGFESAAILRAINPKVYEDDEGFYKELRILQGDFNLSKSGNIVLGSRLASELGVRIGQNVNLLVLSGSSDVELFSQDRIFTVTGIFSCGYAEINSSFAFISLEDGFKYFGKESEEIFGIKIKNVNHDIFVANILEKEFSNAKIESWRTYNKSFFGTLKIEKNMLLLLVTLIFVVVAINIYNGMRRLVFERKSEIAIFAALGAPSSEIKMIFIVKGIFTGLIGSVIGVVLGVLISMNSDIVFMAASKIMYAFQYLFTAIFNHENLLYISENSSYILYSTIPARIKFGEVFFIALFGFISPLIACWAASKNVLKLTIAEVLHNE